MLIQAMVLGSPQVAVETGVKQPFCICTLTLSVTCLCNDEALLCHISPSQTVLSASVSGTDLVPKRITPKNNCGEEKSRFVFMPL